MTATWEIVRQRRRRVTKAPRVYVSLNRRGEIAMNAEAFKRIGQPASVTLLYDANRRTIGVKYPVAMDRHFFPARGYGRGRRMRIVRAARLLKQFGIEVERTLVFADVGTATFDEARMLVLDLDNARELGNRTSEQ